MKFLELALPGVWLIEPELLADERGVFRRHFCAEEFASHHIAFAVVQGNVSENPDAGTLRGFHFQIPPFEEPKTLSCLGRRGLRYCCRSKAKFAEIHAMDCGGVLVERSPELARASRLRQRLVND